MDKSKHWYESKFFNWLFSEKKKAKTEPLTPEQQKELVQLNGGWDEDKLFIPMMTKREAMLRYSTMWKAILFFCLPTIILTVVQTLYNAIDKYLATVFIPEHAMINKDYIQYMILGHSGHLSILWQSIVGNGANWHENLGHIISELFNLKPGTDAFNQMESLLGGLKIDPSILGLSSDKIPDVTGNNLDILKQVYSMCFDTHGNVIISLNRAKMVQYINISTQYTLQSFNLVLAFTKLMALGAGMHYSIEFGRRNKAKLKEIAGNGFTYALMASILIGVLLFGISYRPWHQVFIRSQMGNYKNLIIEQLAWEDVEPLIYGISAIFLGEFCMNMIRSEGKMVHIMIMTLMSVCVNVLVTCLLMKFTTLELTGGQIGTVLAYATQIIYCLIVMYFSKVTYSNFRFRNLWDLKISNLTFALKSGVPNFINYFAFVVNGYVTTILVVGIPLRAGMPNGGEAGSINIMQELISSVAPWSDFILGACVGLNQGVRSIIGYNYGAGNNKRIVDLLKHSSWLMLGWFMLVLVVILAIGPYMAMLFGFPKGNGINLMNGIWYGNVFYGYLALFFMTYPFACFTYISLGLFQGTKRNKVAAFTTSLRALTIYVPMAVIGWAVSRATGNPVWYFVFIGLTDFISALIIAPLLYAFYKRAKDRNILVNSKDDDLTMATYYKLRINDAKDNDTREKYTKKFDDAVARIKAEHSTQLQTK